jgi:hypothetical protein
MDGAHTRESAAARVCLSPAVSVASAPGTIAAEFKRSFISSSQSQASCTVTTVACVQSAGDTSFFSPQGLAVTRSGNVAYAADLDQIRRIDLVTGKVRTIAGSNGFGYTDGQGAAAMFSGASDLVLSLFFHDSLGPKRCVKLSL